MISRLRLWIWVGLVATGLAAGCATNKPPYYAPEQRAWAQTALPDTSELAYTVFLIGDAGSPDPAEPIIELLKRQIHESSAVERSSVIYLGDNIYPVGMPPEDAPTRKEMERRMNTQLDILKGYRGERYMVPGNHDWGQGSPDGLQRNAYEEQYVEKYLRSQDSILVLGGDTYVPSDGCPGPFEVKIFDDVVLIAINSQWFLHQFERPYGPNNACDVASEDEFFARLDDLLAKHRGEHVMVVAHHPILSAGIHGGYFTLADHIFPLAIVNKYALLPLPIIGSVYPFSRKYGGVSQDISFPAYQAYKNGLEAIFKKYPNVVYATGHEHNLQYIEGPNYHHIVSGSGCKTQHVRDDYGNFNYKEKGFARVNYYKNGDVWVEFWTAKDKGETGNIAFRQKIYTREIPTVAEVKAEGANYVDSVKVVAPNPKTRARGLKKLLLGEHYRAEWRTPVRVPYLDLGRELGGLEPYQKGGGKQTKSLKVRTADGKTFVLRSINKDPTQVLPEALRETAARDVLQDQITAQHPYAGIAVAGLADAAGILHTNARLFWIPDDPRLGQYRDDFKNTLVTLEEDARDNHEENADLGYARNLVGTDKVLEKRQKDNDNFINEEAFARTRLFDMFVGDWDRHEGQWRWAERKTKKGAEYTAVPKDRDAAFLLGDGVVPWLVRRKWAVRNFQSFQADYKDYVGLNLTALNNDRHFTASVTRAQWVAQAEDLKSRLTDEAIEKSLRRWPAGIYELHGDHIAGKLRARRDALPQLAGRYYDVLNKYVEVAGSDKRERFTVERLSNGNTRVRMEKITNDGDYKPLFDREFEADVTKEIRLFGFDGADEFILSGTSWRGARVRVIGGAGKDKIVSEAKVRGPLRRTVVYDNTEEENELSLNGDTKNRSDKGEAVNAWTPKPYTIPYAGPKLSLEFNPDDGFYVGGGFVYRRSGFRKVPYSQQHSLIANYAFRSGAYNVRYDGEFRQLLGKTNLGVKSYLYGPQLLFNYFGLGNRTGNEAIGETNKAVIRDYRIRFSRFFFSPTLEREFAGFVKVGVGPQYDQFRIDEESIGPRVAGDPDIRPSDFTLNRYLGARTFLNLGTATSPANPRLGIRLNTEYSASWQLNNEQLNFRRLASELIFYVSPTLPFQATLAGRLGGARNFGDYRFWQANTLGTTTNLRGYRRTRFAGRSSVYANGEVRLELFKFNAYLFPGSLGLLGLYDAARVFTDRDPGGLRDLHTAYGGGVWVDVLKRAVITGTIAHGEETLGLVQFSFLF
ncbi:MAG: metallophosphoesterase [Hymenobacteraceae bacterium]|nr:metallophosphoesterase [Hymenobacteraceae bacterium]